MFLPANITHEPAGLLAQPTPNVGEEQPRAGMEAGSEKSKQRPQGN